MTILCAVSDIPENSAKGFDVGEHALFAVNHYGDIYLYRNSCPHLGVELNWLEDQFLDADGSLIQCASHGALFLIDSGECVAGPCSGQHLQSVAFKIVNGHIQLTEQEVPA